MAYAAVLSLNQILEQISHPYIEEHRTPLQEQQVKSLQGKLSSLLDFLDVSWQKRSEEIRCLESQIRDVACKSEDIIESYIWKNFNEEGFQERQRRDRQRRDAIFCRNLEKVGVEIDSIKIKISMLKELLATTYLPPGPSRLASSGNNKGMVGLDNDLIAIMDRLTGYQTTRQIIPVIGKTTLARNVYDHPLIKHHFHIHAWASISQEYREREVSLSLLDSMNNLGAEMHKEKSIEEISEYLYRSLKGRRYLVVLDDVWNNEAWDSLSRIFPNDGTGSRILLITRVSSVVNYISRHSSPHHMQFLNKTDSWNLLHQEAFGKDTCPHELEEAGKEIAENCKGLPLSLVVIGGYLSNAAKTREHWEYVVENVKSVINATPAHCLEILSLSYDYLPHHLKACFLYMGVFREDEKIRVSKIIKLWVAEGFLKPIEGKTLEQVAKECLEDLISRNLILICDKKSNGKIKTCSIHDMLRELCIKKAQEENFFRVTNNDVKIFASGMKCSRRLCIPLDVLGEESSKSNNSDVNEYKGSLARVRSILYPIFAGEIFGNGGAKVHFPLIRVLDFVACESGFPYGVVKLVHSRYLSFFFKGTIFIPKILPGVIWYLQTLIIDCDEVHLPREIWRMPQLRHLLVNKCYLPCPTEENLVLGNLLTLSKLSSASCTKEVFKRVPRLNKLGICIGRGARFSLDYLVHLPKLESLKWLPEDGGHLEVNLLYFFPFTFPTTVRKLCLAGGNLPWTYMTAVGSMPNLEVLKLRNNVFDGPEWESTEGEFCKLKFLLLHSMNLVRWKTDYTNFERLEILQIFHCDKLEEIPRSIGDVNTLRMIELDDASPSVVTSAN